MMPVDVRRRDAKDDAKILVIKDETKSKELLCVLCVSAVKSVFIDEHILMCERTGQSIP